MKFIIINDIFNTFVKKKCLLFVYFLCLILVSIYFRLYLIGNNYRIGNSILGIGFYNDSNVILKFFVLFSFLVYIYISYYVFLKDVINDYGNIFSRISKMKWLFSKLISIILITFIMKLVSYVLVCYIYKNELNLYLYIGDIMFIYLFQIIAIISYTLVSKSKLIKIILIIICLIIILLLSYNFALITSGYYSKYILLLCLILIIFYYFIIGNKNIKYVLERNG